MPASNMVIVTVRRTGKKSMYVILPSRYWSAIGAALGDYVTVTLSEGALQLRKLALPEISVENNRVPRKGVRHVVPRPAAKS